MRIVSLLSLAFFLPSISSAQVIDHDRNWVENGDFETLEGKKLKRKGGIEYATGWDSPTKEKADLFSEDALPETEISIPKNFAGEQTALSGMQYAGLLWWSYGNKEPRSYMQTKLKRPMKKDSLYCVSYYVNLSDLSKYATGELGAYIGKQKVDKKDQEVSLTYDAQVPKLRTKVYDDVYSWQGVCGVYEASGYEQYIMIGNFSPTEKTPNEKVKRARGETGQQVFAAYYYVDNVEVYPIKSRSECSCEQLDNAESEFIFSRKEAVSPSMKPAERADRQVFYFKRFQRTVDISMDSRVNILIEAMKAEPTLKVKLIGHMDATEMERTRVRPDLLTLAKERADAVKGALVEAGVDAGRILTIGMAGDAPVDNTGTDIGMSKNRRVEVELVK